MFRLNHAWINHLYGSSYLELHSVASSPTMAKVYTLRLLSKRGGQKWIWVWRDGEWTSKIGRFKGTRMYYEALQEWRGMDAWSNRILRRRLRRFGWADIYAMWEDDYSDEDMYIDWEGDTHGVRTLMCLNGFKCVWCWAGCIFILLFGAGVEEQHL